MHKDMIIIGIEDTLKNRVGFNAIKFITFFEPISITDFYFVYVTFKFAC